MKNTQSDNYSAATLLEELKSQDINLKINAIKNLKVISFALGKERTRNELLPYISEFLEEEEDPVLVELSKILSNFLENVGGKAYGRCIFKILETIIIIDEAVVRNEALLSLSKIFTQFDPLDIEEDVLNLIDKLAENESLSQKNSSISVISSFYPYAKAHSKNKLISTIMKFAAEEGAFVKKEIALHMKEMVNLMDFDIYKNLILTLEKDSTDAIRIPLIDSLIELRNHKNVKHMGEFINSFVIKFASDDSWRVRLTFLDKLPEFFKFPNVNFQLLNLLVETFSKFLEDSEAEIRNSCFLKLEEICLQISKDELIDKILKKLKVCEKETSPFVKASLADNILKICPIIGKAKTNDFIFPLFLVLVKDENHEIRLTLLKNIKSLNEIISFDIFVQSVIPSLLEISKNKSWRVRIQTLDIIRLLADLMHTDLFITHLNSLCVDLLEDNVHSIRESGCKLIKDLMSLLRSDDFNSSVYSKIKGSVTKNNYLLRQSVIFLFSEFLQNPYTAEYFEAQLFDIFSIFARDKISNVRMSAARLISKVKLSIKSQEKQGILKKLEEELKADIEIDVVNCLSEN